MNPPYSTVLGWHGDGKVAYLTFDDGPGPYTGRVLDILAAAGVKATFCEIGQQVTENPGLTQRVVAEGHTLCNHSWDHHSPFDTLPAPTLDQEIGRTQDAFLPGHRRHRQVLPGTGGPVRRPPAARCCRPASGPGRCRWAGGLIRWTGRNPGAPAIVSTVLTTVSPGAIILLHDGGGADREQTLAALPGIISGLQAAGYTLAAAADPRLSALRSAGIAGCPDRLVWTDRTPPVDALWRYINSGSSACRRRTTAPYRASIRAQGRWR